MKDSCPNCGPAVSLPELKSLCLTGVKKTAAVDRRPSWQHSADDEWRERTPKLDPANVREAYTYD